MLNEDYDTKTLLKHLIAIPSISGQEKDIVRFITLYLKKKGLKPVVHGRNVYCMLGKGKPTLLLNTHTDTVPPGEGWITHPFQAVEQKGRIYGRGANDAKGCVAAMVTAFNDLAKSPPSRGSIILALTCEEEIGDKGLADLIHRLPQIDAAIIGEPGLKIRVAMKGVVLLEVHARGVSCHAAKPELGTNAILAAVEDMKRIQSLQFHQKNPLLGYPTIAVTSINGGERPNIIPASCTFGLNIRTTPEYPNERMIDVLTETVTGTVTVVANRYHPKQTERDALIVRAAKRALTANRVYGTPTTCDLNWVDAPGIILGPGDSAQSHIANEFILIEELEKATRAYTAIVREYFARSS
ncbi:M20/M25/M40 family metallo-hydrolase [Candidatus Woesearchaeota archaeon]|nr:M20/M25/M40 family metallo-hydrolase [Candidatus Woesearchaeota archaeon]